MFLCILISLFYFSNSNIKSVDSTIRNSKEVCLKGNIFFPTLYTLDMQIPIEIEVKNEKKIFNRYTIYSNEICLLPTELLPENKEYTLILTPLGKKGINIFKKELQFSSEQYPEVIEVSFNEKVNTTESLEYELEHENEFLAYYIVLDTNKQMSLCEREGVHLLCNLATLDLEYGKKYILSIIAMHDKDVVKEYNSIEIETLDAIQVISSSIKSEEVILTTSIPKIVLNLNKEIQNTCTVSITDENSNTLLNNCTVSGTEVSISPESSFKQNTKYILTLSNLTGLDNSTLNGPYTLPFTIGDGPRISSTNISSTSFSITGNIELSFNQNININQNISNYIAFDSGTEYKYSISKNKVTINPNNNLDACKQYSLSIKKGIKGSAGLVSTKTYSYALKTTCARVVSIGTSIQGRKIYSYSYGTGEKKILFYGSIHGSEANTSSTMNKWKKELELHFDRIPSDKTVIVIPTLNPDGVANKSRFNARGVDLNRNFDTSDWVEGTYFKDKFYPTGGGTFPFSEPESQAIKNQMVNLHPYLTLAYHSAAGYVIPSALAKSQEYGNIYSQLAGYRYITPGTSDSFTYDISGSFDDWGEQNSINTLTIELSSAYVDEFEKNLSAMWKMVSL